jgi:hypothetical protein
LWRCSNSSALYSSPGTLSSTWLSMSFYLSYWAFHFQHFKFFRVSFSLSHSSFIFSIVFFISLSFCSCSLWIHSGIYVCFLCVDLSYNPSFEFLFGILSTFLTLESIMWNFQL